jgi:hypothetical protein
MRVELQNLWITHAQAFAAALLDADKPAPDFLTSASGVNDQRRFAVYKNNVTVSLVRALESNFPTITRLIGSEYFTALARIFVEKHPPKTRILNQYGAEFAGFLAAFEPLADYAYLGDVARLEQFWREAFHEADAAPVAVSELGQVAPHDIASLRFKAHPATRLLRSHYAAGSIFSANRSDNEYASFDPAKGEYALITRPHFECALRILDLAQGAFVSSLIAGETLGEAAEKAAATDEHFDLASNISDVLQAGAFCEFSITKAIKGE